MQNEWRANSLVWEWRASTFWCEFGPSQWGWEQSPDCHVPSSAGKEASHAVNSHQCLWWEGRGRESPRKRKPRPGPGSASPGGAQSIRRPESGVRCGAFCATERLLSMRGGPHLAPELPAATFAAYSFLLSLKARTCADVLTQTWTP